MDSAVPPAEGELAGQIRSLTAAFSLERGETVDRARFPGLARLISNVAIAGSSGPLIVCKGNVDAITPNAISVQGISRQARLGDCVVIESEPDSILAQVLSVSNERTLINALENSTDARVGDPVCLQGPLTFWPDESWKGRMLDAFCRPIDGKGPVLPGEVSARQKGRPPQAMKRKRPGDRIATGVAAIDLFTPICYGQRLGIMGGTGTGKSTLLSKLVRAEGFDAAVVALIGERGREVREFVEDGLGGDMERATIIATTGDEAPPVRVLAADTAMLIAEYFRDRGMRVLFLIDSVTRYAHAVREISLAAGEMPVARGHTTMLYRSLSRLLERAGPGEGEGTITGIYSVLVDGDDHNDPIADTVRGILDGHVVLDRTIAAGGRFPAIDISRSISRLSTSALDSRQRALSEKARHLIAVHAQTEEMRQIGGYVEGNDPLADQAMRVVPRIYQLVSDHAGPSRNGRIDPFTLLETLLRESSQPQGAHGNRPTQEAGGVRPRPGEPGA